jgi:hypothetical protein
MVRATSRAPSVGQSNASKIRSRRKKAYKVQVESVVTKKKKLKLLVGRLPILTLKLPSLKRLFSSMSKALQSPPQATPFCP